MTNKFIRDITKKDKNSNPYRISDRNARSSRPAEVPLQFRNLKANTKYKVFLQNNEGSLQEDITRFSKPYGKSVVENNNTDLFDEFISTKTGELFVKSKPFGTDTVSLTNDDWDRHWEYANKKTKLADIGRRNFIVVESAEVSGSTTDKTKTILSRILPITLDAEPEDQKLQRKIKQQFDFDYVQTFFIDPNSVDNAKTVDLTDITLYFRNKPDRELNKTNRIDPGVTVALIDVVNDQPTSGKQYQDSIVNVAWSFISPSTDASNGTRFEFQSPIRVEPGRFYGIAIMFEDDDYVLWSSKRGDILVNTEQVSPGSSKDHRGVLYERTNVPAEVQNKNFDELYTKRTDTDLKFDVHVAEYDVSANVTVQLVNIDQEFLVLSNTNNKWVGSEYVYVDSDSANIAGSVAITAGTTGLVGSSTTFESDLAKDSQIVLIEGSNAQVVTIGSVVNNTFAYVQSDVLYTMSTANCKVTAIGQVDYYDYNSTILYLKKSNANSTVFFDDLDILVGIESGEEATIESVDAFPVSAFNTDLDLSLPSTFDVASEYRLSFQDQSDSNVFSISSTGSTLDLLKPNYVRDYAGAVVSRSLEGRNESTMYDQDGDANTSDGKSTRLSLEFSYQGTGTTSYESPLLDISKSGLSLKQWSINNDTTNEHTNSGNSLTRHISTKLILDEGQEAEDIRVIQNAYRPIGTDIKVYAKILNISDPELFDDKDWTELSRVSGNTVFSEKGNLEDYREYTYTFPSTIPSDTTLDGTVTTQNGNAIITGVDTTFDNDVAVGDVIKLYSEFFEDNYGYFSVVAVTSNTELELSEPISNADIIGSGFKIDTVTTPGTAFLNPLNSNIVRYFGQDSEIYDGYSTVAIKTILLSEDGLVTPRVDDNRVISVSA